MKEHKGEIVGAGISLAIVISRFNEFISGKLLDGAIDFLARHGVDMDKVEIFWVPGIICLGAVIRGDTPHFSYIAAEVTKGIAQVALSTEIPVSFGVLTTDNIEQAIERAGTKAGNKGWSAAESILEMVSLLKTI